MGEKTEWKVAGRLPVSSGVRMKDSMRPLHAAIDLAEKARLASADLASGLRTPEFYANPPAKCGLYDVPLSEKRFMIDGNTEPGGIVWGKGQFYIQLENGDRLLTGGFAAEEEEQW